MSTFKRKANKLKYRSDATTVPECHTNALADFNINKQSIPYKRRKILDIKEELNNNKNLSLTEKSKMMSQIKNLEYEIFQTDENSELLEYASKTADYLINYYEVTSGIYYNSGGNIYDTTKDLSQSQSQSESYLTTDQSQSYLADQSESCYTESSYFTETPSNMSMSSTSIKQKQLDRLHQLNEMSKQERKVKKPIKKRRIVHQPLTGKSILHFLPTQPEPVEENKQQQQHQQSPLDNMILNKATLLHKYLMAVDKEYACGKVKAEKIIFCPDCKITKGLDVEKYLFQSEGCYICKECGHTNHVTMESELPSHKELANEKQKYPYKKINHLKEKLNQFQSKESADVSDDICATVKSDLRKMGIEYKKSTPPMIRKILKKHKWTECYEHLQQIYCKVSGNKPINLSSETEETIINMFQAMQESFRKHCPKERSNFLSYAYVLNKIFRILRMPEHAKYFGLLKSKEKLREQDAIWFKICKDLKWTFYSSF